MKSSEEDACSNVYDVVNFGNPLLPASYPLKGYALGRNYMANHKRRGRGSYQRVQDPYGVVAVNCTNPKELYGTKEYYTVRNAGIFRSKDNRLEG